MYAVVGRVLVAWAQCRMCLEFVGDMIQGWIREVNQIYGTTSHGKRLGESSTWCTIFCKQSYTIHEIDFVTNMGTKSWNCSQHV